MAYSAGLIIATPEYNHGMPGSSGDLKMLAAEYAGWGQRVQDTINASERRCAGASMTGRRCRILEFRRKGSMRHDVNTRSLSCFKRKYRAKRKDAGFVQYVVEVPVDDDAKRTVYAVAQAIVDDKNNTKNIRSIISTVVSDPALLALCHLLSSSGVEVSSTIELIERGDLTVNADRIETPIGAVGTPSSH
ncbi:hypothetical protein ABIB66_006604 [Bradyrhizobium sp. F1.13.3]